jgi:hypothetical protein
LAVCTLVVFCCLAVCTLVGFKRSLTVRKVYRMYLSKQKSSSLNSNCDSSFHCGRRYLLRY